MCDWHGTTQHYKILVMCTIEAYFAVFAKRFQYGDSVSLIAGAL